MARVHPVVALLVPLALLAAPAHGGPSDYVGAAACQACHPRAFESWQRSRHAAASSPATLGRRSRDGACLGCHATGDGPATRRRLSGVQCEACHGPGAAFALADVMRDPHLARALGLRDLGGDAGASCRSCHRERPPSTTTPPCGSIGPTGEPP